jgi:DNA-binding MarR family transcriptional regulator
MHAITPAVAVHLQETLGRVFGLFSKMVLRRQALDPQAMSRTDYALLGTLEHCHSEPGIRISKVAEALGHDLSTISRRVTHLESHGFVERLPDPTDGRASTIRLSPSGQQTLSDERGNRTGLLGQILADWPEEDLEDLDRLLTRLATDLAADAQSATHPPSPLQSTGRTAS